MIPYGHQSVDEDDVAAVVAALRSDRLTQGPRVATFEARFAEAVEARHAVAFGNGTTALQAAAAAAGLGPGDVTATSALTFVASATAPLARGSALALIDIDPETLNLDLGRVPACDALVAVHYAGLPVDLAALTPRPRVVIEDAAHALGARTPSGPVGNCAHSDLCAFSFHPVKAITTAEGGMVTTNSDELAERLRRFRHHGLEPRPELGPWYHEATEPGVNGRLSDLHAALGTSQLAKLDRFVDRRNELADRYRAVLADLPVRLPPSAPPGTRHAYHLFAVRVRDRRRVYDALTAAGIGVQVHYVPLSHHPALADAIGDPALAMAEAAYEELLSLPLYPDLTEAEQDRVVDALDAAVAGSGSHPAARRPAAHDGRSLERSVALARRAEALIPLGTQTRSKGPDQWVQGAAPIFLERGRGAHVWDVDGNRYLDWPMALGPVLLGYAEPVVDAAVRRQLDRGITFTLPHPLELEVAERIVALCPGVEAVRFGKSGSDAVTAAVRAARALTGRDLVLTSGYHGWHDWYVGTTGRDAGVPTAVAALTEPFPYGDAAALDELLHEQRGRVAAVVLEPSGETAPPDGYLEQVVSLAAEHGAVSIFDEVICGFRVAPGGARERYGVEPDLSCYGKALGNGMPISAVAGPWSVMRAFDEVFFSQTHGGEALSLAAAAAVLDAIADGSVLAEIAARGARLQEGLRSVVESRDLGGRVEIGGEPSRSVVRFVGERPDLDRSWVQQHLAEASILFNGSLFVCARHRDEDVETTLEAFDRAGAVLEKGEDVAPLLRGAPVRPVFAAEHR